MKRHYFVICSIAFLTAMIGRYITSAGMGWYKTLILPSWTPQGWIISSVWIFIFILTTISAIIVWDKRSGSTRFFFVIFLFCMNAVFNIMWSHIFFGKHFLDIATFEAAILGLITLTLMVLLWPISRKAAFLLLPYVGWVVFATYLTYTVWQLNI
ncbi:MAG: TspO/MBR family protein [bacterium]